MIGNQNARKEGAEYMRGVKEIMKRLTKFVAEQEVYLYKPDLELFMEQRLISNLPFTSKKIWTVFFALCSERAWYLFWVLQESSTGYQYDPTKRNTAFMGDWETYGNPSHFNSLECKGRTWEIHRVIRISPPKIMSWIVTNKDLKNRKPKKEFVIKRVNPCAAFPCRIQPTNEFTIDIRGESKIVWLCDIHK